jgi:hypothetical protein
MEGPYVKNPAMHLILDECQTTVSAIINIAVDCNGHKITAMATLRLLIAMNRY